MVEYRTDEERLSAIINFFNDYKKFFVWGSVGLFLIVLVFISVSNFRANQDSAAYSVYSKWSEIDFSDESKAMEANGLFNLLQDDYSSTGFSNLALVIESSRLAEEKNLDDALDLLYKLKNKTSRGNLFNLIANLNIGRIEIVNGNFDLALKALDAISLDKENATVASLKGDALRGLGRLELAEAQYTKAIDLSQIAEERAVAEYKLKLISQ